MSIVPVKDRLVIDIKKDLEWLFFSESIVSGSTDIEMFTPNTHLQSIQGMPTSLTSYSPPPTYRLGRQFEDAIALLFKHSERVRSLQRNLVITGENRTLGELDCLYENSNGSCVHLELAIKFYLYTGDKNSLDSFIGPGGKDRLDKKWNRLIEHQLPLSNTPAALQAIHHVGFASPKIRQLLLTGILFYPYHNWRLFICPNPLLNPQHLRGWWLFQTQIDILQDEPNIRFIILPRWHWIGGIKHYDTLNPLTFELMKQQVQADNTPKMLACVRWDRVAQCWQEISRGFLVRDNWPAPLKKV